MFVKNKPLCLILMTVISSQSLAYVEPVSLKKLVEEVAPLYQQSDQNRSLEKSRQSIISTIKSTQKDQPWSMQASANKSEELLTTANQPGLFKTDASLNYGNKNGFKGVLSATNYAYTDYVAAGNYLKDTVSLTFSQDIIQGYKHPTVQKLADESQEFSGKSSLASLQGSARDQQLAMVNSSLSLYLQTCLRRDLEVTLNALKEAYEASRVQVDMRQISMKDHLSTVNLRDRFTIQAAQIDLRIKQITAQLQQYSFEVSEKAKKYVDNIQKCEIPEVLDSSPYNNKPFTENFDVITPDIASIQLSIEAKRKDIESLDVRSMASLKPSIGLTHNDKINPYKSFNEWNVGITYSYTFESDRPNLVKKSKLEDLEKAKLDILAKKDSTASELNSLQAQMQNQLKTYPLIIVGYKNSLTLLDLLRKQSNLGMTDALSQANAYQSWYDRINEIRNAVNDYATAKMRYRYLTENKSP